MGLLLAASSGDFEDLIVRDTIANQFGVGAGVVVQINPLSGVAANVAVRRAQLVGNTYTGLAVFGSDATLEDVVVRDTRPTADGAWGRGIEVQPGTSGRSPVARIRRTLISGSHELGLGLFGADATVESTLVRETRPQPADGSFGDGIAVVRRAGEPTAAGAIEGVVCQDNARAGIFFGAASGRLNASALRRNGIGLAIEEEATPAVGDDNLVEGNQTDVARGRGLPAAPPLAVPDLPQAPGGP